MNSIRRLAVTLAAGTRLLLGATDGNVANASTIYASEATFLSAAGSVTVEDFEQSPLSGTESAGAKASISFAYFTASSIPTAVKVLGTALSNGNHAVSGSRYLSFDTDVGDVSADATLTFYTPIRAIGFYLIDAENNGAVVTINGTNYSVSPMPSGGMAYFGDIDASPFTTVKIDAGPTDSHWSIDKVSFVPVPEPSIANLLPFLVSAICAFRRTRHSLPNRKSRFSVTPKNLTRGQKSL
jgi:hypothetical protein